eukprot:scaffold8225_cov129-Isochrysis_galbana.AAC.1
MPRPWHGSALCARERAQEMSSCRSRNAISPGEYLGGPKPNSYFDSGPPKQASPRILTIQMITSTRKSLVLITTVTPRP